MKPILHEQRIQTLNREDLSRGEYVLYWMQASQRGEDNHALEHAICRANQLNLPVVACFGLAEDYPDANERHFAFLLEGLAETRQTLAERGVCLVVARRSPVELVESLVDRATLVVCDRGYLRHQVQWRRQVARLAVRVVQVESDVVVPVEAASNKQEYAARTLRPRHQKLWDAFLQPVPRYELNRDCLGWDLGGIETIDVDTILGQLRIDRSVARTEAYRGGASRAQGLLGAFVRHKLADYAEHRSDPSLHIESDMSPYLHFGQISPIRVALAIRDADAPQHAKDAYLEELLIRRELAINFVTFCREYDSYKAIPGWARTTLRAHKRDAREYVYTKKQFEQAGTHDPYWNAAMTEMIKTGKMHNYMRMYWGKKIIEWTNTPQTAWRWMLEWNNKYFLDGRDPASYANVAWCFGLHDRPWRERAVFGTVRYLSAGGLERKFDIQSYCDQVERL
jgi:deoxyribodipyrimidine photo-lyase